MMPFHIVSMWLRGLLSITFLLLGPYLLYRWYEDSQVIQVEETSRVVSATQAASAANMGVATERHATRKFAPQWGFNRPTAMFVVGLGMFLWAIPKPGLSLKRLLRRRGTDERGVTPR